MLESRRVKGTHCRDLVGLALERRGEAERDSLKVVPLRTAIGRGVELPGRDVRGGGLGGLGPDYC